MSTKKPLKFKSCVVSIDASWSGTGECEVCGATEDLVRVVSGEIICRKWILDWAIKRGEKNEKETN